MHKLTLTLLMIILAASLAAQTGLWGLSYDDSREDAIENLLGQGFSIDSFGETYVRMVPDDNYKVDNIELVLDDQGEYLVGWSIYYNYYEDGDIEDEVLDALEYWHGDDYYWDEDMEEYYWYLSETATVYAGYDWYGDYFFVDYVNSY